MRVTIRVTVGEFVALDTVADFVGVFVPLDAAVSEGVLDGFGDDVMLGVPID